MATSPIPNWMNDAIAEETTKFSDLFDAVERTENEFLRGLLVDSLQRQEERVITALELRETFVQAMFERSKS